MEAWLAKHLKSDYSNECDKMALKMIRNKADEALKKIEEGNTKEILCLHEMIEDYIEVKGIQKTE